MKNIAVIIPCYNESLSIIQVIDEIHSVLPSAQIYVFDNNSTDNSASLVQYKIAQIAHTRAKLGGGGIHTKKSSINSTNCFGESCDSPCNDDRFGLPRATSRTRNDENKRKSANLTRNNESFLISTPQGESQYLHLYQVPTQGKGAVMAYAFSVVEADIFIMIDADSQCDTSILPRALQIFNAQNLDMLNIARLANEPNLYRKGHKFGNALFTKIAQMLFGKSFKDLLSGYRIFSRAFVKSFPATSKGFEIETELSIFALQCQMRIGEISAPYRSRPQGSFSKLRTFRDGFKILAMILQLLFTERPLFVFGIASILCFAVALILGVPLVVEFLQTSKVPRFPTAFVCVGFGIIGVVLGIAGLLAHLIGRNCKEMRRFVYLLNSRSSSLLGESMDLPKQSKNQRISVVRDESGK